MSTAVRPLQRTGATAGDRGGAVPADVFVVFGIVYLGPGDAPMATVPLAGSVVAATVTATREACRRFARPRRSTGLASGAA